MAIVRNTINYLDGDTLLEGYFAFDDAIQGARPTVLISHAWAGRGEFVDKKAEKIAELGYFAFALDMYGKGVQGKNIEENSQLMQPFMDNRHLLQQRISAALYAVRRTPWADEKNIAAIGFCFGGLCVLDLARTGADLKGIVSFHGLVESSTDLKNKPIKAKVLLLTGNDDSLVSPESIIALQDELTAGKVDWQLHRYGRTMHAFTNPKANDMGLGTLYNKVADKRSWQTMQNFLSEIFS